jgi:hypothetical protein
MPRTTIHLEEQEIKMAIAYWILAGCPEALEDGVTLVANEGSSDPRESSRGYITATVQDPIK